MTEKSIRVRLAESGERRQALRNALEEETEIIRDLLAEANAEGMSEYEMVRLLKVSKTSVRTWLGK